MGEIKEVKIKGVSLLHSEPYSISYPKAKILFVHGAWGSGFWWKDWLQFWSNRGYECWAMTLRGHEEKDNKDKVKNLGFEDFLLDMLTLTMEIRPNVIVGHSMGGLLSLKACESLPVGALVLVSPVPFGIIEGIINLPSFIKGWKKLISTFKEEVVEYDEKLAEKTALIGLNSKEKAFVHSNARAESARFLREVLLGKVSIYLSRIAMPRLVVVGSKDKVVHPITAYRIAQKLKADFFLVYGGSHIPYVGATAQKTASFVESWVDNLI